MKRLFLLIWLCVMMLSTTASAHVRMAALSDEKSQEVSSDSTDAPADSAATPVEENRDVSQAVKAPVVSRSRQEICDTLVGAAHSNDLPVPFFIHLLFQESGFQPDVVSRAGAQGIAQFMPETAATVGLDNPFDPLQAISAAARLLRNLVRQFGNVGLAAAAYNAGPKRIQDWLAKKGRLPEETQHYVKTITGRPAEKWTTTAAGNPTLKLPREAPCQQDAALVALDPPQEKPARSSLRLHSVAVAMMVRRARSKSARHEASQLAWSSRKNHRKMRLSQR